MLLAHARVLKRRGERLNKQQEKCFECEVNKMVEEKEIKEAAQEIRTTAVSKPKRKQRCRRIAKTCQMCGRKKSCQKCHGLFLCTACTTIISQIKIRPEIIQKAWEQFGPNGSIALSEPIQGTVESIEGIDFDRLMDAIDAFSIVSEVFKGLKWKIPADKKKEFIKTYYGYFMEDDPDHGSID